MNSKQKGVMRCLDPEKIIPISRGSTEQFKTGTWSRVRPVFLEKTSPCRAGCPVGNDIPRALYLASEGDYDGALAIFLQESALPGVCGRVCYHPCQAPCNRAELDGAIQITAPMGVITAMDSFEKFIDYIYKFSIRITCDSPLGRDETMSRLPG